MTSNEEKKRILDRFEELIPEMQITTNVDPRHLSEVRVRIFLSQALDSYRESVVGELRGKIEDMLAAHERWSNTELAEYARGGKESCEDILALLPPNKET